MEKMRENAPLLRFVEQPSLRFNGGLEITKDSKFEEEIVYEDDNGTEEKEATQSIKRTVNQKLDNLVLTTKTIVETTAPHMGKSITVVGEDSQTITLYEGCRLVFQEGNGYIVPNRAVTTLEEAIKSLNELEKVTHLEE